MARHLSKNSGSLLRSSLVRTSSFLVSQRPVICRKNHVRCFSARSLARSQTQCFDPSYRFYACMSAYFDLRACTEIHGYACTYTHPCILSSGSSQTLPLETVEFALERVFASKKYGRAVPELLLLSIREAANDGTNQFICALLREGWYRVLSVGNSLGFVIDDSRRFGRHEFQICVANGSL